MWLEMCRFLQPCRCETLAQVGRPSPGSRDLDDARSATIRRCIQSDQGCRQQSAPRTCAGPVGMLKLGWRREGILAAALRMFLFPVGPSAPLLACPSCVPRSIITPDYSMGGRTPVAAIHRRNRIRPPSHQPGMSICVGVGRWILQASETVPGWPGRHRSPSCSDTKDRSGAM